MQRDKRAHRTFGDIFGRTSRADFTGWAAFKASPLLGWIGFILLCTVITFLMTFYMSSIPERIAAGAVAQRDIRSDSNYEIIDEEATNKFKEEAIRAIPSVYDYDAELANEISKRISEAFEEMRRMYVAGGVSQGMRADFEAAVGIKLPEEKWREILAGNFSRALENDIVSQVSMAMARYVVTDKESILSDKDRGITVREASDKEKILNAKDISGIISIDELRKKIRDGRYRGAKGMEPASWLAAELAQANTAFNLRETEQRRKGALANVKNVIIKVEAGEMIIRGGSRYEPRHVIILNGIRKEKEKVFTPFKILGVFLLVALVILSTYYFAERYIKKFAPRRGDLYFMGVVLIFILVVLRLSVGLSRAIYDSVGMDIPLIAFYYAIPVGGAAMLIRFVLNSETALVFSIVASIFAGVFVGGNLNYTAYSLISSIAAAASIAYADKRSAIIRAGVYTSVINVFAVVCIQMIHSDSLSEPLTAANLLWCVLFAVVGGFSCSAIVTLVTPLAEYLFGYTTDIKLLELANLNHPLLRELVIRAPGTYHHSHLVGILAESASEVIGANPLLARVAAYYHDIGKIRKPLYFVENTADCESRYEKLSPHMSALIVASHVKDGLELAKEYKIPDRISDMIPQHHGTKMISFFYEKALKEADPALHKVDEKDFRYQGPKPKTKEAGILLLADAVEAAVRSLKEKTPARIQQMVEDVINRSFTEAQLDECDLTLRNLHDIAGAFTKILMGIYHQRIEYPKEMLRDGDEKTVVNNG